MGSQPSIDKLYAIFVDPDGRIEGVIESLQSMDKPIEVQSVPSVTEAISIAKTERVDCLVVMGAEETADKPAIDGMAAYETATEELEDVPIAVYPYNWQNKKMKAALSKGIETVKGFPEYPELIYRQLRSVADMEEDPRSDSELLNSLFEYYPHQLFLKDDVGRFEGASEATAQEYGLTGEEIVGLTDFDLLDTETAKRTYEEELDLLETGEANVERIVHYIDEKDRDRWVSITKAPRYDDDGNPVGIVGSSRDVTKEKRKEYMVRELHEASRELVRSESKTDIGRAAMQLTADIPLFSHIQVALKDDSAEGLTPLETTGSDETTIFERYETWFVRAAAENSPQYISTDGEAVADPGPDDELEAVVLPLGEHGSLGLAADADTFTDFGIDLAHILASNLEATLDRADRELELERQNERLEEFASIVSHDLRNPLNVASAAAELVGEETDSDNVDRIKNALERMDRLIEALLTLARKGKIVGETEFVSIEDIATDAWEVIDAPDATLTIESNGIVAADRNRLAEVFENLFRNAIEHGREDATVAVGVRDGNDGFYVADDGPGIDPDIRDKIFDMGYSQHADGTGYGLYIVARIADAHGWAVEAGESETGGARFDIRDTVVEPV